MRSVRHLLLPVWVPLCVWAWVSVAPAMARPQLPDEVPASEEGDGAGAEGEARAAVGH